MAMGTRALTLLISAALVAGGCADPPPPAPTAPAPLPPGDLAARMEAQARALLASGRYAEADHAAREAGRLYQQLRGPRHPDTGRAAEILASVQLRRGEYEAAEQSLLWALAVREAEAGPSTLRVAEVLDMLGKATESPAPDRTAAYLDRALAIRRAVLGPDHPEVVRTLIAIGSALLAACRTTDAEAVLREALATRERTDGPSSATVAEPLENLADARWQVSDDTGSEQLLARAAAVLEPLEAREAEHLVRVLGDLAAKERERKDFASAAAHGERGLSIAERRLKPTSPALVAAADGLATTYRAQGNEAAASALFQRLSLVERVLPPGAVVPSPPPNATPDPPRPRCTPRGSTARTGGSVTNASSVVAGLAPGFRACYNSALRQDPNMSGSIRLIGKIGAAGEVLRVRTLTPASYAEIMVKCPMERLLAARFTPPEGGGATIVVPVTFVSP